MTPEIKDYANSLLYYGLHECKNKRQRDLFWTIWTRDYLESGRFTYHKPIERWIPTHNDLTLPIFTNWDEEIEED